MPSSPGYKRNYVQERLAESPKRKKDRAARNKARSIMMKEGKVHKGDGKDVGHIKAISKGGITTPSNLMVQSQFANRSYSRTSTGAMASETSAKERSKRR